MFFAHISAHIRVSLFRQSRSADLCWEVVWGYVALVEWRRAGEIRQLDEFLSGSPVRRGLKRRLGLKRAV